MCILVLKYYQRFNNIFIMKKIEIIIMKLTAINFIKAEACSTLDGRQVEGVLQFFLFLFNFNVIG